MPKYVLPEGGPGGLGGGLRGLRGHHGNGSRRFSHGHFEHVRGNGNRTRSSTDLLGDAAAGHGGGGSMMSSSQDDANSSEEEGGLVSRRVIRIKQRPSESDESGPSSLASNR